MNKTLLLIICDFLLLNLLALTRWDKPEVARAATAQVTSAQTVQKVVEEDLVDTLRATLEEERQVRDTIGEQLQATKTELQTREETLAERERRLAAVQQDLERKQAEAAQLGQRVNDAQSSITQLSDRLTAAAQQAATSRSQAEQLARELAEKQEAAARLTQQVQQLEQDRVQAQQQIQSLSTQMQVAETERTFLRESVDTLRTQVGAEREEKLKLQENTGRLADGVTQLAESSAGLREEIRANTPVNANTLFNDFLANRVDASFRSARENIFGPVTRNWSSRTILVSDGKNVYALFHVSDTPATFREFAADWREIDGILSRGGRQAAALGLKSLLIDPRVAVVQVDATTAAALGSRVYPTAAEPFKFPEAVLVSGGGKYYGEVEFKLDPQTPGYVKMKSRIFSGLFGEFSPSSGDIVFSKTGELLGLMVNNDYCVLVDNFAVSAELPFGAGLARTSEVLSRMRDRVARLPLRLQ
jgi:predicted  nucleic acid-binding Zn-ribbon protein